MRAGQSEGPDSSKSWPVRTATSYGGVVVRAGKEGQEVALIRPRKASSDRSVWALPKGGRDESESPEAAALREVREETGLLAEIVEEILPPVTYWFVWAADKVRYRKTVHFYLMRMIGGDIALHDNEVDEVRFFPLDRAAKNATYPSERKVLEHAARIAGSIRARIHEGPSPGPGD